MKRALVSLAALLVLTSAMVACSGSNGAAPSDPATRGASVDATALGPLSIVCVTELHAVCERLTADHPEIRARVEDAATTASRLASGAGGVDAWLTFEPWPDITNGLASDPVFTSASPLASSPLVISMVKERAAVLGPNCTGGMVGWKCLGEYAGRPWTGMTGGVKAWGNVTVGNPPLSSAVGLLVFGDAVVGYFGRADVSTADLDADPRFASWRANVQSTFKDKDPFDAFVSGLPSEFAAVGGARAETSGLGGFAPQVTVVQPAPQATAVVTLAPVGTARQAQVEQLAGDAALADVLRQAGWDVGQIPPVTGLPDPSVLLSLSGLQH